MSGEVWFGSEDWPRWKIATGLCPASRAMDLVLQLHQSSLACCAISPCFALHKRYLASSHITDTAQPAGSAEYKLVIMMATMDESRWSSRIRQPYEQLTAEPEPRPGDDHPREDGVPVRPRKRRFSLRRTQRAGFPRFAGMTRVASSYGRLRAGQHIIVEAHLDAASRKLRDDVIVEARNRGQ